MRENILIRKHHRPRIVRAWSWGHWLADEVTSVGSVLHEGQVFRYHHNCLWHNEWSLIVILATSMKKKKERKKDNRQLKKWAKHLTLYQRRNDANANTYTRILNLPSHQEKRMKNTVIKHAYHGTMTSSQRKGCAVWVRPIRNKGSLDTGQVSSRPDAFLDSCFYPISTPIPHLHCVGHSVYNGQ